MLEKLDFCLPDTSRMTNVYGLMTLNTPKEKILILGPDLAPRWKNPTHNEEVQNEYTATRIPPTFPALCLP